MTRPDFPEQSLMGDGRGDRPFEAQVKACYPPDYLAAFYRQFEIDDEDHRKQFRFFLVNAGCRYLADPLPLKSRLGSRELRKELEGVAAQIGGLRSALQTLTPQGERRLWNGEIRARSEIFPPDHLTSSFGHKAVVHELSPDNWLYWYLERDKIEEALEILANYASAALENLRELPSGRPGLSEGLRMWIYNANSLWTRYLGRPFTSDWNKNEPLTPAARFCLELLQRIDPALSASKVESAMRKEITERRRAKRKNPE